MALAADNIVVVDKDNHRAVISGIFKQPKALPVAAKVYSVLDNISSGKT